MSEQILKLEHKKNRNDKPQSLDQGPSEDQDLRQKIFTSINLLVAVIALFAATLLWAVNAQQALIMGAVEYSTSSFALHLAQKKLRCLQLKAAIYLLNWLFFTIIIAIPSGGIRGPMSYIFLPVPIIALIFFPVRQAIGWTLITICSYIPLFLSDRPITLEKIQNLIFLSIGTLLLLSVGGVFRYLNDRANQQTRDASRKLTEAQAGLLNSAKLSSLGEMAGGIAHEINSPLACVKSISNQLQEVIEDTPIDKDLIKNMATQIEATTDRIAKIVQGLRTFSRDGSKDPSRSINVQKLIEETLSFCNERFKHLGTDVTIESFRQDLTFEGRATEISQVLLNLLNNAHDAILNNTEKWVKVSVIEKQKWIEIQVTDSGRGIPQEIQKKLFQPFFTTKEIGKGTGIGLSISAGIIQNHQGELKLDMRCANTRFVICLPKVQIPEKEAA